MNSNLSLVRFTSVAGLAAAIFLGSVGAQAAGVGQAPTVPPAPVLDQPLAPAANDTPDEQPTLQHVWVPGHWRWSEGSYVWEAGRWEVPPAANVAWVAPQWQRQGNGYGLKEGFWQEIDPAAAAAAQPNAAQPETISVTEPPPAPQREIIYERPNPTYVWIPGYWGWREGRHVWIAGQWTQPPRANVAWVAPRWEPRAGRYVFVNGFWRDAIPVSVVAPTPPPAPPAQVVLAPQPVPPPPQVIVVSAPPPVRQEIVYARPAPGYIWVPGYWNWRAGRYVWIAGHWSLPPRGRNTWEQPRWERRGGNYIFIEGRWR
jgi:hypothetical protein